MTVASRPHPWRGGWRGALPGAAAAGGALGAALALRPARAGDGRGRRRDRTGTWPAANAEEHSEKTAKL